MADDMYDEEESSPSQSEFENPDSKSEKSDRAEDQLALVPMHFFKKQPKPGGRETVEVVEVYEGEVSIKCVYGDKEEKERKSEGESSPQEESEDSMMM